MAGVVGAAIAIATLLHAPTVAARWPRPHDAPAVDPQRAVPEVTPEYASIEDSGIRLVYHPLARERAHALLARARAIRTELSTLLGRSVLGAVEIRVAAMPAQMIAIAPAEIPSGAAAVAFREHRLVVMSLSAGLAGDPPDLEERLRHELAHLALDEAAGGHDLPRWFHEGFAVHVSGEDAASRAESLCLAALHDRLIGLRDVDARFPDGAKGPSLALAEAADFVRFLVEGPARDRFPAVIERLRAGEPLERALPAALGSDIDAIETRWRKEMARRYSFVPVFVGATLLWLVVALGILVRRRRIAALRRTVSDRRSSSSIARFAISEPPEASRTSDPGDIPHAIPPDPEVPKIEHGGRWYTLH
ncbi:Hypothetical protein A7982_07797 [Minicystis rosea]|nr:Hypothetical protein A7982_07797 [Minicystis rosea]